ncbi:MAG: DNA polymerase III subunit delta [Clostridia bacterium]|nr:DNA polymerase III subunit delta [Clostridia bacterium]
MKFLNEHIKNRTFKQVYLIYGEETYLVYQYRDRMKAAIIGDDTMNYSYYEGNKIDIKELLTTADTMPFFAERRLIIVQDSGFFKSQTAGLADYIHNIPDYLYIVFVESEVDKRNKLYKAVSEKGYVSEMKYQTDAVLMRWIQELFKSEGKNIGKPAMEHLLSKTGIQMSNIKMEIEKLVCYAMNHDEITIDDIDAICTTQIQNKIFDMITAIAMKRQKEALELYYDLLLLREPPMRILYLITRQFNMMLKVKELVGQRYNQAEIARQLGIAGFLVSKYISQSKHFSLGQIMEALEYFAEVENDVKTGLMDEKMAVELIIIKYSRNGD